MQTYQAHIPLSQRSDPPRNEERVRVALEILRPGLHSVAGQPVKGMPGDVVEVVVYRSDLPSIQAKVETDVSELAIAERQYRRAQRDYVAKALGLKIEEVPEDVTDWDPDMVKAEKRFAGSTEAEFQRMTGHGIRAFKAMEVVEEGLPPPVNPYAPQPFIQAAGNSADVEALRREIEALKKAVASSQGRSK